MKFKQKPSAAAIKFACIALTGTLSINAAAQSIASSQPDNVEDTVHKVEVTGSNIKRVNLETSSELQIITREEINQSGATTVKEILDNLSSATGGIDYKSGNSSFAAGASGIALRSLGQSATLTLLNGRRVSNYALANSAKETFTNLDSIPADFIERVEILKDGASAIYGSDAIAGVINIITVKQFNGVKLSAGGQQGHKNSKVGNNKVASITAGFGNLQEQGFNVVGHLEFFQSKPYSVRDIANQISPWYLEEVNPNVGVNSTYSWPGNWIKTNGLGETVAAAGCAPENIVNNLCTFDQWANVEIAPKTDRINLMSTGRLKINNTLQAFSELQFSNNETKYLNAVPIMQYTGSPISWFNASTGSTSTFFEPLIAANNPFNPWGVPMQLRYRYADNPGMFTNTVKSNQYRLLVGLEGEYLGWDWNTAIGIMGSSSDTSQRGGKHAANYLEAINSGAYQFGGKNDQSVLDKMFPEIGYHGNTQQKFIDAKASRELMPLDGGFLAVAVGADFRTERFEMKASQNLIDGEIVNYGSTDISGSRNISAAFVEFNAPFTKKFEANFALRADKSSNAKGSLTPKLGLKYNFSNAFMIRGTAAEGFRAPNLPEIGQGYVSAFNAVMPDPKRCQTATAMYDVLKNGNAIDKSNALTIRDSGCRVQPGLLIVPNKDLEPEKARTFSLGFVVEPTKNINFAVDYFYIEKRGNISRRPTDQVFANEDNLPGSVVRDPVSAQDIALSERVKELSGQDISFDVGQARLIRSQYENLNKTRVQGIDLDLNTKWKLPDIGRLTAGLELTYNLDYRDWDTITNSYTENLVGNYGRYRYVGVFKTALNINDWNLGARVNFSPSTRLNSNKYDINYTEQGCAKIGISPQYCKLGSDATLDMSVIYSGFKNQTISLNIKNLLARESQINVKTSSYPYRDRIIKLSYDYSF